MLDYDAYHALMRRWEPDVAYFENVWPRSSRVPGQSQSGEGMGFVAASKFMKSVGALEGVTAGYVARHNRHKVTPVSWMNRFGLLKISRKEKHDRSRALIVDLFPDAAPLVRRKKDEGRATSGLIGAYGAERQGMFRLQAA